MVLKALEQSSLRDTLLGELLLRKHLWRALDSIFTLNIVGPQANLSAVRFSPVDTTSEVFIYVVQEATIDGQALQTGDEIALFSGDLCVGAGIFNGVMPFLVRAYGADQTGFADGDPITVKAWDYGESRIASKIGRAHV